MCQRDDSESDAGDKHRSVVWPWSSGPGKHIWTASESQMEEILEGLGPSRQEGTRQEEGVMLVKVNELVLMIFF